VRIWGAKLRSFWRELRTTVIWEMLRRQAGWVGAIVGLNVVNGLVLRLLLAQTQRSLIDRAIIEQTAPMGPLLERYLILVAVEALFGFALAMAADKVSWSIEYDLRNWLYERLQQMAAQRLDTLPTGQLVTRATSDIFLLERLILFLPQLLRTLPLLVFNSVLVMTVNVPLGLLSFAALPISIWIGNHIRNRFWGFTFAMTNESAKVTSTFDEAVRGIRVVKAFGQEDQERSKLDAKAHRLYDLASSRGRFNARWDLVSTLAPNAVRAAMLIVGFVLVVKGNLTLGTLSVVLRYAAPNLLVSGIIDDLITFWQTAKTGMGRIQELITWEEPESSGASRRALPDRVDEGLAVEGLSVRRGERAVLDGLDLDARPGELVVVAGPRGAGKSTLALTLTGDLVPDAGRILLEGVDTGEMDLQQLRRAVRLVGEEPYLFGRSLRYNLEFGADALSFRRRTTVPEAKLLDAVRAAAADDILAELPDGLATVLGDRGLNLSGGQRQRLALARALVDPPRVLVLDDALSAVHPSMELEILQRIRVHCPRTAVVVLSRRAGPERLADRVVALTPSAGDEEGDGLLAGRRLADEAARWLAARDTPVEGSYESGGRSRERRPGSGDGVYDERLLPILAAMKTEGLRPDADVPDSPASRDVPITMRSTLAPFTPLLGLAVALLVGFTFLGQLPELLSGRAQDATNEGHLSVAITLVLVLFALQIVSAALRFLFRFLSIRIDQGVLYLLRMRLFRRLSRLGVDYYDREAPGKVAARVVFDLDRVSAFTDEGVTRLAQIAGTYLFTLVFMLVISAEVTLYVLLIVPVIGALTLVMTPLIDRALARSRDATGEVTARLQEDFAGRYVVKTYGAEQKVLLEYFDASFEVKSARRVVATLRNLFQEAVALAAAIALVVI
jgi:ATP-binding cassette subfamily B protein